MVGPMRGKVVIAFFLGLFSLFLFLVVGSEAAASVFGDMAHIIVIVILMGAYFFYLPVPLIAGQSPRAF